MRTILNIIFISLFLLIVFNCNNDLVSPPDEPGNRDYVWTVDTFYLYNSLYRIWGSAPDDVWAINSNDYYNSIYHFDGNEWSSDGLFRHLIPTSIFGFAKNNVYIGGQGGKIWQFDGNNWNETTRLEKEGTDFIVFENMWGKSSNNFYAFGNGPDERLLANHSVIAHYINSKWNILNTNEIQGNVYHLYQNASDRKIYFLVSKIGGGEHVDSTIIYEYTQEKYNKLYSSTETKGKQADISLINNEVYFILGNEIAKRKNNQFETVLSVDNPNFYQRIWGRSSKDIFLSMTDGLAHYNGTDIEYLYTFNKSRTYNVDAAIFGEEVFFLVFESPSNLSLIYHGKLTE